MSDYDYDDSTMPEATICLVMIVKNEAHIIDRLASSVRDHIDHYLILDTGSTDDTIEVARKAFAGTPGHIFTAEWEGYGPSRNRAFQAAETAFRSDWLLHLDADDLFVGHIDLEQLATSSRPVETTYIHGNLSYQMTRLVPAGEGWHWKGRAHEYLTRDNDNGGREHMSTFYVQHVADGGNHGDKAERELELLQQDWAEEHTPRTAFYMARTYQDIGRFDLAIVWYRNYLELDGWDEERWFARYSMGVCLLANEAHDYGCGVLWSAWGERKHRAEPLAKLAEHYRNTGQWVLAFTAFMMAMAHAPDPKQDRLFVDLDVYTWRMEYEGSISAYYVGELELGVALCASLLVNPDIPDVVREQVKVNEQFYLASSLES
jgi:glycosyltransferase involved in cell wall biosynthesis